MTSGARYRKVTAAQRHQFLQVYLHMGQEVAAELCVEHGVSPRYAYACAQALALIPQRKFKGGGDISFSASIIPIPDGNGPSNEAQ